VDLILDGDAGEINEIQQEFLGIVKENADRLVSLINDMLDISRIESGRVHLKIEPLAIEDSIAGTVDSFRAVLDQSGRTIKTRIPDNLPKVAADRDRVGQVLMNFVSNAVKYSPEGGDVVITAKRTGDRVSVSVTDHGMGISREDQKQLFTKFYRVDNALTREIGGTGLGLSICKSIIELLGGKVRIRSKFGEGSTFTFTLPVASKELVRTPYVQGPEDVGGKVLVVDRDPKAGTSSRPTL
jgi:signal transduction histidine kinase